MAIVVVIPEGRPEPIDATNSCSDIGANGDLGLDDRPMLEADASGFGGVHELNGSTKVVEAGRTAP